MRRHFFFALFATILVVGLASSASGEALRLHYKPDHCAGYTSLKVAGDGAVGEFSPSALGLMKQSYYCQPKATHMVTYRHPVSCRNVTVPIAFPQGTPRIAYQSDAIVYSYGLYTIRVEFLNDGSVDVLYNSGLFRPLQP